ncbi:hypothetical protein E2C01_001589 [Portunus trituberculatus]|uniref:Uncharacterized protein n=1 Tax=Portunus trituberculatus TaxID=210409 RepID=A0A5B7CI11_PORTR|nr:hypothetical protein [Portunus trituberculatus]
MLTARSPAAREASGRGRSESQEGRGGGGEREGYWVSGAVVVVVVVRGWLRMVRAAAASGVDLTKAGGSGACAWLAHKTSAARLAQVAPARHPLPSTSHTTPQNPRYVKNPHTPPLPPLPKLSLCAAQQATLGAVPPPGVSASAGHLSVVSPWPPWDLNTSGGFVPVFPPHYLTRCRPASVAPHFSCHHCSPGTLAAPSHPVALKSCPALISRPLLCPDTSVTVAEITCAGFYCMCRRRRRDSPPDGYWHADKSIWSRRELCRPYSDPSPPKAPPRQDTIDRFHQHRSLHL